jgi:hypothetical protein
MPLEMNEWARVWDETLSETIYQEAPRRPHESPDCACDGCREFDGEPMITFKEALIEAGEYTPNDG